MRIAISTARPETTTRAPSLGESDGSGAIYTWDGYGAFVSPLLEGRPCLAARASAAGAQSTSTGRLTVAIPPRPKKALTPAAARVSAIAGSCTVASSGTAIDCTLTNPLGSGASVTATVQVKTQNTVTNVARVSATTPDPEPGNNTSSLQK